MLAVLALSGSATSAADSAGSPVSTNEVVTSGPKIYFAEPFFDFGRVQSGQVVTHDFIYTNTGNEALKISDVRSSCGCTAVTNWDRRIEPGQTGTIHVLFNTGGMAGQENKNLWVVNNDPTQPAALLEFTAMVWKWIDAIPAQATFAFGPNDLQTNETRVIRLVSNLEEPVTISPPVCKSRFFKAELTTVKPGKEFDLRITVVPPLVPGSLVAPITMKTSSPQMPEVSVTAYALVQPALTVMPPQIRLPATLEEAKRVTVTIRNNSTNPLVLSDPEINANGAGVQLREVQPGKLFDLVVTFPAGFHVEPGRAIEACVKSNHPQSPLLKVPVTQLLPAAS